MKILAMGKLPWVKIVYTCSVCKCKFQLDETDRVQKTIAKGHVFPCPQCETLVEL